MVQATSASKNIWVAASDGDLDRVRYLIEQEGLSPNVKDSNSYSPMHAAASYAHHPLLLYLLSKGGNINLSDDDGETPLFTVESIDTARLLIENGADPLVQNDQGQTAAEYLQDDHPEISSYLLSLVPPTSSDPIQSQSQTPTQTPTQTQPQTQTPAPTLNVPPEISQQALDALASSRANTLLQESQRIMEQAQRTGIDPDDQLRQLVERAVREGILVGGEIRDRADEITGAEEERKRSRPEE
ncbi:ankyrin repeat-containing domain protein [Naematelia encephala]|uniref:Ankyrin repeat-containing domain protein n=1 Tax=Naematelia encephala TaxID=71784 RepID=A0A1Y2BH36_9TREE|nr:ankyrin repeat-containing domain protein [Naematelia encephala]